MLIAMKHALALSLAVLFGLAGCASTASPGAATATGGSAPAGPTTAAGGTKTDPSCSGGLTGNEPGVVRISCNGTADIRIQVAATSKEIRGGSCRSGGQVWSAAAGVIIDVTGTHGTYTGPPVDSIAVNNTDTAGKGTIQIALGDKHYFDLGGAALTLSADQKTAHLEGTGDRMSDGPNDKITVDVTC